MMNTDYCFDCNSYNRSNFVYLLLGPKSRSTTLSLLPHFFFLSLTIFASIYLKLCRVMDDHAIFKLCEKPCPSSRLMEHLTYFHRAAVFVSQTKEQASRMLFLCRGT